MKWYQSQMSRRTRRIKRDANECFLIEYPPNDEVVRELEAYSFEGLFTNTTLDRLLSSDDNLKKAAQLLANLRRCDVVSFAKWWQRYEQVEISSELRQFWGKAILDSVLKYGRQRPKHSLSSKKRRQALFRDMLKTMKGQNPADVMHGKTREYVEWVTACAVFDSRFAPYADAARHPRLRQL